MPTQTPRLYSRVMLVALLLIGALAIFSAVRAQPMAAAAPTLKVGDPAPPLATGKWIKGEPVTKLEKNKLYIIEFWATWCAPCRRSIPQLSQLQAKYPTVTFIGQDSLEEDTSTVADFVKEMGDKMNYRVVLDDVAPGEHDGKMVQTWLKPSGSEGIPMTFVVGPDTKIAWMGHPMELERVIGPLVAGTFDPKKEEQNAATRQALAKEVGVAARAGKFDDALVAIDKLLAIDPTMAKHINVQKFMLLLTKKDFTAAYALAKDLAEANKDDSELLCNLAWIMVDPDQIPEKTDFTLAEKIATRANEIEKGKNPDVLDILANAKAAKGDLDAAISIESKALLMTKDDQVRDALQASLDRFKAAQKAAKTSTSKPTN